MQGFAVGHPIAPQAPLSVEARAELRSILEGVGALRAISVARADEVIE
jgi:hypothetical protein